jgi:hypothetical protein
VAAVARAGGSGGRAWPCRFLGEETHPAQSRLIRADLAAARPARWLTPAVADYIAREGLYRREKGVS